MMIEFIGKTLLIDKKVLVIGDLHLGYGAALIKTGVLVPTQIYQTINNELQSVFERVGKVEHVVLLGDLKHAIGTILYEERQEIAKLVSLCCMYTKEIFIVKGNHDALLEPLVRELKVRLTDYHLWNGFAFIHGDKDFPVLHERDVKTWVMGHFHPAITLRDGAKAEKYKCFLHGKHKRKEVIIVPSFFPGNEGSDIQENYIDNPWNFDFDTFNVMVVEGNGEALDFGKLGNLQSL